jgi:hypothetical protein
MPAQTPAALFLPTQPPAACLCLPTSTETPGNPKTQGASPPNPQTQHRRCGEDAALTVPEGFELATEARGAAAAARRAALQRADEEKRRAAAEFKVRVCPLKVPPPNPRCARAMLPAGLLASRVCAMCCALVSSRQIGSCAGGYKTALDSTGMRILCVAAKQGPNVLFCMPNRTEYPIAVCDDSADARLVRGA